jgi:hypothetical protein
VRMHSMDKKRCLIQKVFSGNFRVDDGIHYFDFRTTCDTRCTKGGRRPSRRISNESGLDFGITSSLFF